MSRSGYSDWAVMNQIKFTVYGCPAPQGSKVKTRWGMREDNPRTGTWREAVKQAVLMAYPLATRADSVLIRGPVVVHVVFTMPRPKSAKKGALPDKKPDVDKLLRSTFDAMTEMGCWEDDSRVVCVSAWKVFPLQRTSTVNHYQYVTGLEIPGAAVIVEEAIL